MHHRWILRSVDNGTLAVNVTLSAGSQGSVVSCLSQGCYELAVSEGVYPHEVSWMLNENFTIGGAPFGPAYFSASTDGQTLASQCTPTAAPTAVPTAAPTAALIAPSAVPTTSAMPTTGYPGPYLLPA